MYWSLTFKLKHSAHPWYFHLVLATMQVLYYRIGLSNYLRIYIWYLNVMLCLKKWMFDFDLNIYAGLWCTYSRILCSNPARVLRSRRVHDDLHWSNHHSSYCHPARPVLEGIRPWGMWTTVGSGIVVRNWIITILNNFVFIWIFLICMCYVDELWLWQSAWDRLIDPPIQD